MTTLKKFLSKPLFKQRSVEGTSLEAMRDQVAHLLPGLKGSKIRPERDAIAFYLLNHAFSIIRAKYHLEEALPADVEKLCEMYVAVSNAALIRLVTYLLLITTRESRHVHKNSALAAHKEKWPQEWNLVSKHVNGHGSDEAVSKFLSLNNITQVDMLGYVQSMEQMFDKCSWSGGYGGKAWGEVARALRKFLDGTMSGEMLLDTAYTLAHNNGPIFNKGMCFNGHTGEFYGVLDAQRGGAIPNILFDAKEGRGYFSVVEGWHLTLFDECQKSLGKISDDFSTPTDWWKIEALGALHNVDGYKHKQKQFGIVSPDMEAIEKMKAKQAAAAQKKKAEALKLAQMKKEELAKNYFMSKPGTMVKKTTIDRA